MSSSKTSAKKVASKSIPPSGTSRLFTSRKAGPMAAKMTSERIAADLAAFRRSGGRIEVLDNYRHRSSTEAAAPTPVASSRAKAKG
ncbi:MAG: hypothetical protein M0Q42_08945 [Xanthomonadales bacterium]|nr:hypothetical protein [Xanthomonadales bacterium]